MDFTKTPFLLRSHKKEVRFLRLPFAALFYGNDPAVNRLLAKLHFHFDIALFLHIGTQYLCFFLICSFAGDQRYAKSLQVDYLNGQETPTIRRSEVPGRLGFVWDIWLDWGITAVDFRGIAKNPGTTI